MINLPLGQSYIHEPDFVDVGDSSTRFEQYLLNSNLISFNQLNHAKQIRLFSQETLIDILIKDAVIDRSNLPSIYSKFLNLPLAPETLPTPLPATNDLFSEWDMIHLGFAPIGQLDDIVSCAISSPENIDKITKLISAAGLNCRFFLANPKSINQKISEIKCVALTAAAEHRCPEKFSVRHFSIPTPLVTIAVILIALLFLFLNPGVKLTFFLLACAFVFVPLSIIKWSAFIAVLSKTNQKPYLQPLSTPTPKISILVPLFKEHRIISALLQRLEALNYPKSQLQICLLCEDEDHETLSVLRRTALKEHIELHIVGSGTIQTKPRALNYALPFCTGDIICVFDAEDAPEPDQLKKAVQHLRGSDLRVACVQARLSFYNSTQNWLSRCFTLEYGILFNVFLPGLQRLGLPIPLGGTSMFLRRDVLEEVGAWDAHNVTEDADLGMRLYRAGYRVECLDSTTFEEANHRVYPWIKQRSRWLKGFLMTWLALLLNPKQTIQDMGWRAFAAMTFFFFSTVTSFLLLPLILPLWGLSIGMGGETFSNPILAGLFFLLAIGAPYNLFAGCWVTLQKRNLRQLWWVIPTMMFYWPIACIAAYKAAFELLIAPFYWDKTEHGVDLIG